MWRSDSSGSSRTGCPPDIVNEEDLTVGESEYPDFRKWNIPKVSTKSVYDVNWTEKSIFSEYRARTIEQTFSISKTHEKCCLFSKKNINEFLSKKNLKYLHIGLVQVAVKPLTRKGIDASVLMCLRDARFKKFNDSILGMITASLYDGPVYFDCYPDLALALDDPNIIKALTLNILTSGYDMDDGSRPFTLIYRIFYRLLDSQLTPRSRGRDPAGKTMLIQCSIPDAKIQVPKMIQWQDITLSKEWSLEQVAPPIKPVFDELDLTKIAQYSYGTVKIFFDDTKCFPTHKPLRINEGRKSFVGSESIVKRNADVDEFLKKNFEPLDLKLKGVASNNSQVSNTYYSTKPEFLPKDDQEEEEDAKSEAPSGSDFPPIETPPPFKHLRVINLLDMDVETPAFQIDMVALSNEFFSKANRDKRKYYQSTFAQSEKDIIKRKWREKMNLLKQHILFFDYLENYYVSRNEHDKTVVKSSHPPLETVLITCKNDKESTEVKASPFKIADDKTPVSAIIEQNNFTNESLHIIGQQLDRIEEKIDEKPSKPEKPLIDLPSQRKNIDFKTSQSKTFDLVNSQGSTVEKIEKMLADLKVKTEQTFTSRSAAYAISRSEKEVVSDADTNSDSLSSKSSKNAFDDDIDLPEIKRFVGKPNPTIFTKNWYSKPTPPDVQFEERSSQTQFSVSADKLYDWNIDGFLDHPDIVDLLASCFTGCLRGWWDSHLTEESRESIKHAVKRDTDGMLIFYQNINRGVPDGVNTLVYTILKHFVGTPSNISSRISDYLNNLRCPTMSDYRWYQDVFTSRVMLRKDSMKPYWKEKFIDGLPPIFAHKVKNELIGKNDSIDFDNLTYGDIFSTIKKIGINMCNDEKWLKQQLKDKKKAKYEMGNFCEQYGLPPIAPSRQKGKSKHDKRSGKGKCFNCGKFGHFSKDYTQKPGKLKNKLNMLNILESAASTDSFEEDFSSSSDSDYHSRSDVSKPPNIKLGCRDSCCNVIKSVKMLTKSKENDDLLLTMISKIEDPNLQKDYLDKFLKNLTKEDKVKRPNSTISFEETLKRFNKNKSKEITVNDLQHEIKTVKQEIIQLKNDVKTIKHDNDHLKQELLILKIDKTMDKHQFDDDEQKDGDESDQQVPPSGNVSDCTLINLIDNQLSLVKHMLPKWYTKVKIVVAHDYAFDVVAMIDSGADVNCIQQELIPTTYFEKSTERLVSANGTKMKIKYELNNAHVCHDNVCFKIPSVLVKNMTDKSLHWSKTLCSMILQKYSPTLFPQYSPTQSCSFQHSLSGTTITY
ncbi:hypothetical protein ACB092_07G136400 [Castanea dentata]